MAQYAITTFFALQMCTTQLNQSSLSFLISINFSKGVKKSAVEKLTNTKENSFPQHNHHKQAIWDGLMT